MVILASMRQRSHTFDFFYWLVHRRSLWAINTILLKPEENKLTEVVVTALGIKRSEKSLGYAVQKVSGKELQTVKGVDIGTSLTGRVAV
ncbi:hypothetical protein CS542_02275 [Pedobacter sp. IW39]|nr:hypothetical protein CS542_02275 [Pedobacter sp. IW39]